MGESVSSKYIQMVIIFIPKFLYQVNKTIIFRFQFVDTVQGQHGSSIEAIKGELMPSWILFLRYIVNNTTCEAIL